MSDFEKAFPPIPVRDDVPAICFAVAILGIVVGGFVVAARMQPADAEVAINTPAPSPSAQK
jgi:hypothetical protein